MIEMIVAFCIVIVEQPRHKGGESICGFYRPEVKYDTFDQCRAETKLIESWFEEEAMRIHPKAIRVEKGAVCGNR